MGEFKLRRKVFFDGGAVEADRGMGLAGNYEAGSFMSVC